MAVGASSGIGAKDACPFWYGASHGKRRRKYDGDGRREQVWHEHGQNMEQKHGLSVSRTRYYDARGFLIRVWTRLRPHPRPRPRFSPSLPTKVLSTSPNPCRRLLFPAPLALLFSLRAPATWTSMSCTPFLIKAEKGRCRRPTRRGGKDSRGCSMGWAGGGLGHPSARGRQKTAHTCDSTEGNGVPRGGRLGYRHSTCRGGKESRGRSYILARGRRRDSSVGG